MKRILYLGLDPARFSGEGALAHWPIIRIDPRPLSDSSIFEPLARFDDYSHLVITSKNCAAILFDYLEKLSFLPQSWSNKITIAVGRATAAYLQKRGIAHPLVAEEETAEGVLQVLEQLPLSHTGSNIRLFWPHSAEARPVIQNYLIAKNIAHHACAFYDVRTNIPPGPLPSLDDFDEIVFTSPSTVKAFLEVFGSFPLHAVLRPIGPITEKALLAFQS